MPNVPGSPFRLHPVALYVALIATIITIVLIFYLRRHRPAGTTTALALTLSGLAQFLITFLRQPEFEDNALGTLLDPIQWVALGMIVLAALLWQQPRRVVAHAV